MAELAAQQNDSPQQAPRASVAEASRAAHHEVYVPPATRESGTPQKTDEATLTQRKSEGTAVAPGEAHHLHGATERTALSPAEGAAQALRQVISRADMRVGTTAAQTERGNAELQRLGFPGMTVVDLSLEGRRQDVTRPYVQLASMPEVSRGGEHDRRGTVAPEADLTRDKQRITESLTALDAGRRLSRVDLQSLGDTLSTLNSVDIAKLREQLRDQSGSSALDRLVEHPNLNPAYKTALSIYLKGTENRTTSDISTLAQNAVQAREINLFRQALNGTGDTDRAQVRASITDDKLLIAFGRPVVGSGVDAYAAAFAPATAYDSRELRMARLLLDKGHLPFEYVLNEQRGITGASAESVKAAIDQMPPSARKSIIDGERVSRRLEDGADRASLSPQDRAALADYQSARKALTDATNPSQAIKWLDYIDNGGTQLIGKLAEHRGVFRNSSDATIQNDLQHISQADWLRAKSDPTYQRRIDDLLKTVESGQGLADSREILGRKFGADVTTFEQSRTASDLPSWQLARLKADSFRDEMKVLKVIEGFDQTTLQRYASDPAYRERISEATFSALGSLPARDAAARMLKEAEQGRQPELTLTERLRVSSESRTLADDPKVMRENLDAIKAAIAKDPALRERILRPGPEDKELQAALREAFPKVRVDGPGQVDRPQPLDASAGRIDLFETYARPFVENGRLTLRQQAGLSTFDRQQFTRAIAEAPKQERDELLNDPSFQRRTIGYWSPTEQEIAKRAAANGFVEMQDRLHLAISGKDKAAVEQIYGGAGGPLKEALNASYNQRYGSIDKALEGSFKGAPLAELQTLAHEPAGDQRALYNQARDRYYRSRDGWFSGFIDQFSGTGLLADNAHDQYSAAMSGSSRRFESLPPAEQRRLFQNVQEGVRQFIGAKEAAADTIIDAGITLATIPGSGGTSLLLRGALLAAAARPAGKALLLGDDYNGHVMHDAIYGGTLAAVNRFGPAQVQKLFSLGEKAAESTSAALVGQNLVAGENAGAFTAALNSVVRSSLENGGKIDAAHLSHLTSSFAVPGQEKALAAAIEQQLSRSSTDVLKDFFRKELLPNTIAAGGGGGAMQFVESSLEGRPTEESLSRAFTSFLFASPAGALGSAAFRARGLAGEIRDLRAPETIVDGVLSRATTEVPEFRRQWSEFVQRHQIDATRPRDAVPVSEFFEAPAAGRAQREIPDAVKKERGLPREATEERDVVTYRVKGSGMEIVVDKGYARQLDELRQLRLSAAEAGSSDAQRAELGRQAAAQLERHPLKDAVLPEQVVQELALQPNAANIRRVDLYGFKTAAEATASNQFNLEIFSNITQDRLRGVFAHENSHLLQYKYSQEFDAFAAAARVESKERGGFFARGRAHDADGENFAVHFGENFINPDAGKFALVAQASPARALAQTALLERALKDAPESARLFQSQFAARAEYVEQNIVPLYKRQVQEAITKGDIEGVAGHLQFLDKLRETPYGKRLADAVMSSPESAVALRAGLENAIARGDTKIVSSGALGMLAAQSNDEAVAMLKRIGGDARFVSGFDDGSVVSRIFTATNSLDARKALVETFAQRGALDRTTLESAARSLSPQAQKDLLGYASGLPSMKGKGELFLQASRGFDEGIQAEVLNAAKQAGVGRLDENALIGLEVMRRSPEKVGSPVASEAGRVADAEYDRLAAEARARLSAGQLIEFGAGKDLAYSGNPEHKALFAQSEFIKNGGKPVSYVSSELTLLLNRESAERMLPLVRPYLTDSAFAELQAKVAKLEPGAAARASREASGAGSATDGKRTADASGGARGAESGSHPPMSDRIPPENEPVLRSGYGAVAEPGAERKRWLESARHSFGLSPAATEREVTDRVQQFRDHISNNGKVTFTDAKGAPVKGTIIHQDIDAKMEGFGARELVRLDGQTPPLPLGTDFRRIGGRADMWLDEHGAVYRGKEETALTRVPNLMAVEPGKLQLVDARAAAPFMGPDLLPLIRANAAKIAANPSEIRAALETAPEVQFIKRENGAPVVQLHPEGPTLFNPHGGSENCLAATAAIIRSVRSGELHTAESITRLPDPDGGVLGAVYRGRFSEGGKQEAISWVERAAGVKLTPESSAASLRPNSDYAVTFKLNGNTEHIVYARTSADGKYFLYDAQSGVRLSNESLQNAEGVVFLRVDNR